MRRLLNYLTGNISLHQAYIDGIGYFSVYRKLRLASLKDIGWEAPNKAYGCSGEDTHSHQFLKLVRLWRIDIGYLTLLSRN